VKATRHNVFNCPSCVSDAKSSCLNSTNRGWAKNGFLQVLGATNQQANISLWNALSDDNDSVHRRLQESLIGRRSGTAGTCKVDDNRSRRVLLSRFLD
jgi:hypothetical protein